MKSPPLKKSVNNDFSRGGSHEALVNNDFSRGGDFTCYPTKHVIFLYPLDNCDCMTNKTLNPLNGRYTFLHTTTFKPVRIQVRINPLHPLVCRKRRLNGAVLRMRSGKPRPRVTVGAR
jgi:hypothetical protein